MTRNAQKAFKELKELGCPVFERSDVDLFCISGEDSASFEWADYYQDFGGACLKGGNEFGLAKDAVDILSKYGLYAEWENAGGLIVYQD